MPGSILTVYWPGILSVVSKDLGNASISIAISLAALLGGVYVVFTVCFSTVL